MLVYQQEHTETMFYVAVVPAVDVNDVMPCPNPNIHLKVLPNAGMVRLQSASYDELVSLLVNFVGLNPAEAAICISKLPG